jgi:hypothetical protein
MNTRELKEQRQQQECRGLENNKLCHIDHHLKDQGVIKYQEL